MSKGQAYDLIQIRKQPNYNSLVVTALSERRCQVKSQVIIGCVNHQFFQ